MWRFATLIAAVSTTSITAPPVFAQGRCAIEGPDWKPIPLAQVPRAAADGAKKRLDPNIVEVRERGGCRKIYELKSAAPLVEKSVEVDANGNILKADVKYEYSPLQ